MNDVGNGCAYEDVLQHDVDISLLVVDAHVLVRASQVADAQQLLDQRIGLVQKALLLFLQTSDRETDYLPIEIE